MQKKVISELAPVQGGVRERVVLVRFVRQPMTRKRWAVVAATIAVLVLAVAGYWWLKIANSAAGYIDGSKYQAVFIANNQAYFGKLQRLADGSYRLTNVYYLQQASNVSQKANSSEQTPQLVKMGSELHGPTDQVIFDEHQVLFWENLRSDSKVSKAIDDYMKK